MNIAITIIGVLLIIMSVFLVIAVLMQSSKDHRLGGSIAGGAETFFGKTKGKSMDAMFNKLTTVIAIVFVVLVLVLFFIAPDKAVDNDGQPGNEPAATEPDMPAPDNNDEGSTSPNMVLPGENGTENGTDNGTENSADNGTDNGTEQ